MEHWRDLQEQAVAELARSRFRPLTPNQEKYFEAIEKATITICTGPAGCGKTYIPCGLAAQMLKEHRIERIILTRPMVTCGHQQGMGWFPGGPNEKISPYLRPLLDALGDFFSPIALERAIESKFIEIAALDLMRGRSIKNSLVICDEAQNATFEQLHMLLTRLDYGTRIIVSGDASQTDLPHRGPNPLLDVIQRISPQCHSEITVVRLTGDDVVRPPIVRWIDGRLTAARERKQC